MGMLSALGIGRRSRVVDVAAGWYDLPSWSGDVSQVEALPAEIAEAFQINLASDRVTRLEAMRVPAVRRARNLIAGTIGTGRLVAQRSRLAADGQPVLDDPRTVEIRRTFLEQPDPGLPLSTLLTWTVDDLLFYPVSWWRVTARRRDGFPAAVARIAPGRVQVNAAGEVRIDGERVPDADLIRFDAPDEGLLWLSSGAVITAAKLEATVRRMSDSEVPTGYLDDQRQGDVDPLTPDEINDLLDQWAAARRARQTAFLNSTVGYHQIAWTADQLDLTNARARATVDVANALNIKAELLNTAGGGNLTYTNTQAASRELVTITLAPFVAAIGGRLSMGDVTPAGQTVSIDLSAFIAGTEAERIGNAQAFLAAGLGTRDEARARYLGLPPATGMDETQPPAAAPTPDPQEQQ